MPSGSGEIGMALIAAVLGATVVVARFLLRRKSIAKYRLRKNLRYMRQEMKQHFSHINCVNSTLERYSALMTDFHKDHKDSVLHEDIKEFIDIIENARTQNFSFQNIKNAQAKILSSLVFLEEKVGTR